MIFSCTGATAANKFFTFFDNLLTGILDKTFTYAIM